MSTISFGTSGWRGIMAEDFTFTGVRAVTCAIGEYVLKEEPRAAERGVVIGYDPRFLSEAFAAQAGRTLAGQGITAFLCDRDTPTPVVAFEILRRNAAGGIVITASHNPPEYNGVKFSAAWGGPALPEATRVIQARANQLLESGAATDPSPPAVGPAGRVEKIDPREAYLARIRGLVHGEAIREAGLKVVVDPLYGSARGYLDALLREFGCEVIVLHDWRDPHFGGQAPEPSEKQLQELAFRVADTSAQIGVATDGDADRFGLIDSDGSFLEPNYFLGILLRHLVKARGWQGGAARSVATSHLIDAVARNLDIPLYETPVGFKYIGELIAKDAIVLGGEESAGLSVKGHVPEKDGILACLLAVELMASRGRARLKTLLQEVYREVGTFLTRRINFHLEPAEAAAVRTRLETPPEVVAGLAVVEVKRIDGVKLILEDGSWVLLRPSGTEPVVRLYVEAASEEQVEKLRAAGEAFIRG
ncbi:MAG TPA: phosphoglucomutase/phosphomannomutase family protein [Candidatus Baltobacteraceae bacterium]|nr:phosphoglucomutase/phosphomannomutase family protein [Candidatus Baltobacteraceae bacterium]